MNFKLYTIYVLLVLAVTAFADEPLRHQEVIITANPIAADEIDTDFQTGHVTVINKNQFDAGSTNVAEVLKKESGIQIRSIGGLGTYSSISMRGSTSSQVNIYLDGMLVNEALGGGVDLSQFLLGNIQRIEVYRGNSPVQLGYSGIGGAINIVTNNSVSDKVYGELSHRVGSFETQKTSVSFGDQINTTNYSASFEILESDNDFQLTNINKTPDDINDDFSDRRNNGELRHYNMFVNVNSSLSHDSKFMFSGQFFDKDQELPDQNNTQFNTAKLSTDYANFNLKYDHWFKSGLSSSFKYFYSEKNSLYDDRKGTLGVEENLEATENISFGITSQISYNIRNHFFNINLDSKKENYTIDNYKSGVRSSYDRLQFSLGIQDEWISQTTELMLTMSARVLSTEDAIKLSNKEITSTSSTFHTGLSYQLDRDWLYKMNLSSDIRSPSLSEKFGDQGYTTGNPDLVDEEAINFDAGFQYKNNNFKATGMYFYRDLVNAILMIFNSRGIGEANNISKARVMGVELDVSYALNDAVFLSNRLTLQDSQELSDSRQFGEGRSLPGISTFDNFFSIGLKENDVTFTIEYEHKSGGFYDSKNIRAIKDLNQINLNTLFSFPKLNSSLELVVQNLGGQEKEEFNGFKVKGVSAFAEYKVYF